MSIAKIVCNSFANIGLQAQMSKKWLYSLYSVYFYFFLQLAQ